MKDYTIPAEEGSSTVQQEAPPYVPPPGPPIERRQGLSYEEFTRDYERANRAVIITDVMRDWKALSRWSPEFFKQLKGNIEVTIDGRKYRFGEFLNSVMASTLENPAPYFRNQLFYKLFPELKDDIEPLPAYFFPNWLTDHFLSRKLEKRLNRGGQIEIYIGGAGRSFPSLHYDGLRTHAYLMHVFGRKQFFVYPPSQTPLMYPRKETPNLSMVQNVERPDLQKYPLFAKAAPTIFVLEPGEMLFIPSGWWHTTRMLTPCISLSINTANASNWSGLTRDLCSNPINTIPRAVYLTGVRLHKTLFPSKPGRPESN